jgi:hypothetical protein
MARTESAGTPSWLANGEFRRGTCRRRLPFRTRQRGTNQGPMNRPLFNVDLGFRLGWLGSWCGGSVVRLEFWFRARFNLGVDRSVPAGR